MQLATHHRLALAAAVLVSAIALIDAVTHGLTGHYSIFADESDQLAALLVGDAVHGMAYVAFVLVLARERERFSATNLLARGARRAVLASLGVLAVGFLVVGPALRLQDIADGPVYAVFGVVVGIAFAGFLLGSLVVGLALWRHNTLGVGTRVLMLMLPVLALTLLMGLVVPDWQHPAYLETTVHIGLSLLGVGSATRVGPHESSEPVTLAGAH